jgi:hypothetical protein
MAGPPTASPAPKRSRRTARWPCSTGPRSSGDEAEYVEAARAANTLRGYRSDWREFTTWCAAQGLAPLPAAAISGRLSGIKFAHQLRDLPDPTGNARVLAVWEGTRRTHGARPSRPRR